MFYSITQAYPLLVRGKVLPTPKEIKLSFDSYSPALCLVERGRVHREGLSFKAHGRPLNKIINVN